MHATFIIHAHVLHCTLDAVCDTLLGYVRQSTSQYVHGVRRTHSRALLNSMRLSLLIQGGQVIIGGTLHCFPASAESKRSLCSVTSPFLKRGCGQGTHTISAFRILGGNSGQ